MKQKLILLIFLVTVIDCNVNNLYAQILDIKEINSKREGLHEEEINYLERYLDHYRTKSLRKIKKELKKITKNSEEYYSNEKNRIKNELSTHEAISWPDTKKFGNNSVISDLVKQDARYKKTLKKGLEFGQFFKNDSINLYITPYDYHPEPFYQSHSDGYLKKIYYKNGHIEDNLKLKWAESLNYITKIDRRIPIDSLEVHFSISTICEYDTLVLQITDVNKTIENIIINEFDKNHVSFSVINQKPHVKIIGIEAYAKDNKILKTGIEYTNSGSYHNELSFIRWKKDMKQLNEAIQKTKTKEAALLLIKKRDFYRIH